MTPFSRIAGVEIGELTPAELPAAAALLARAYRDNGWMVALVPGDPAVRERVMTFAHRFRISALKPPPIVACREGELVGVCAFESPERVPRSQDDQVAFVKVAMEAGPDVLPRLMELVQELDRRAPAEPHWHLGPVGVRVDSQRQGIASRMLERFCAMLDERGDVAFLETEERQNVGIYEKFGWAVLEEAKLLGVPAWFMLRRPRR